MKVDDKFHIRGRGNVFTMTNDREVAHKGASLRRIRDGATWPIRGVERYCKVLSEPLLFVGEGVGFLMPDDCDLSVGETVEVVPSKGGAT